jgi:phenylacetic acid degradation operon negative regulatory protein
MKEGTELLIYYLLWAGEKVFRPTFRNLISTFEEWAYREGFARRLRELEHQRLLECESITGKDRRYRLSERGRFVALGGRDPEAAWNRQWDGKWRLVVYDLPATGKVNRTQLRRILQRRGFGRLQRSVWITPDELNQPLVPEDLDPPTVDALTVFETHSGSNAATTSIVARAWDFGRIEALHRHCQRLLGEFPRDCLKATIKGGPLETWLDSEHQAWTRALSFDPLLPRVLLPDGYLGEQVWRQRQEVLRQAAVCLAERLNLCRGEAHEAGSPGLM